MVFFLHPSFGGDSCHGTTMVSMVDSYRFLASEAIELFAEVKYSLHSRVGTALSTVSRVPFVCRDFPVKSTTWNQHVISE
jgi:hypothetical protein